jgi:hypothetical protein
LQCVAWIEKLDQLAVKNIVMKKNPLVSHPRTSDHLSLGITSLYHATRKQVESNGSAEDGEHECK